MSDASEIFVSLQEWMRQIPKPPAQAFFGVTTPEAAPRHRMAWSMRQGGATYIEIGAALGVSTARARQIVVKAEERIIRATSIYSGAVIDPVAYDVWHTFTHDGRVTHV